MKSQRFAMFNLLHVVLIQFERKREVCCVSLVLGLCKYLEGMRYLSGQLLHGNLFFSKGLLYFYETGLGNNDIYDKNLMIYVSCTSIIKNVQN